MDANELAEVRERRDYLARREREFEDALANTTDILGDNHLYACSLRRADARWDFGEHAPADIDKLLAEVERLRKRAPTAEEAEAILGAGKEAIYDGWVIRRCPQCGEPIIEDAPCRCGG